MPRGDSQPQPSVWFPSARLFLPTNDHRPPTGDPNIISPRLPAFRHLPRAPILRSRSRLDGARAANTKTPERAGKAAAAARPTSPPHTFVSWPRHSQASPQRAARSALVGSLWDSGGLMWRSPRAAVCVLRSGFPPFPLPLVLTPLNKKGSNRNSRYFNFCI
jgi:hypothetical protein